jgi:hypothetical protein
MRWRVAIALAAAAALAGCGGPPGELITITESGGGEPPLRLTVLADSQGSCNNGPNRTLPSDLILDAREAERELAGPAKDRASYSDGPRGARRYTATTNDGVVTWVEGARAAPKAIATATLLAVQLKRLLC